MTHDELLQEIDAIISIGYAESGFSEYAANGTRAEKALRAVVELHTPDWRNQCSHCLEPNDHDELNKNYLYPCPTIQAIEDVLE